MTKSVLVRYEKYGSLSLYLQPYANLCPYRDLNLGLEETFHTWFWEYALLDSSAAMNGFHKKLITCNCTAIILMESKKNQSYH